MTPSVVLAVVRDGEAERLVAAAFPAPEFELQIVTRPDEVVSAIAMLRPQVVVAQVADVVAETSLVDLVERAEGTAAIIVIADTGREKPIIEALETGADGVVGRASGPEMLTAKARALTRLTRRASAPRRRPHVVEGAVSLEGPLPLIKHCERHRVSGRLTVRAPSGVYWIDFFGGEFTGASGSTESSDLLAGMLEVREGGYVIEQRALASPGAEPPPKAEPHATGAFAAEESAPGPVPEGPRLPEARKTRIESAGPAPVYEVETRGENLPNYTVTTLVRRGGEVVRRSRREWPYPLRRQDDWAAGRLEIDTQHERASAALREMTEERPASATTPDTVDATLLAWVMHFVVEQVWNHLGSTVTTTLLRKSHAPVAVRRPPLRAFQIRDGARVDVDLEKGAVLPVGAVAAVAEWLVTFLAEVAKVAPGAGRVNMRQSTVLMANALERVGFFAAYDEATRKGPVKVVPPRRTVAPQGTPGGAGGGPKASPRGGAR
jgi:hypothetical protein